MNQGTHPAPTLRDRPNGELELEHAGRITHAQRIPGKGVYLWRPGRPGERTYIADGPTTPGSDLGALAREIRRVYP